MIHVTQFIMEVGSVLEIVFIQTALLFELFDKWNKI